MEWFLKWLDATALVLLRIRMPWVGADSNEPSLPCREGVSSAGNFMGPCESGTNGREVAATLQEDKLHQDTADGAVISYLAPLGKSENCLNLRQVLQTRPDLTAPLTGGLTALTQDLPRGENTR